jgi:N-acetylneuraminic acid mutarotase
MRKLFPFMLLSLLILSSFAATFNSVSALELVEDSWNTKASMNQARWALGVVAVDGKIYAIGGSTVNDGFNSGVVGINECYYPKSDTWVTLEPMPTPRSGFAIAAYQGKIYCMGGTPCVEEGMKPRCDVTEVYDIATNSWSTKASMPFQGSGLLGHVVNGKIFVINGNALFMYDPVTDIWTRKPDAPLYLFSYASAVVDDKIILTGNVIISTYPYSHSTQYAVKAMIYDIETDTWSEGKTETTLESSHAGAEATTGIYAPAKIYVFSGTPSTFIYEPTTDTWSTAKSMPSNRIYFGVAVLDDILYVIGGLDYPLDEAVSTNEQYVPIGYDSTGYSGTPSPVTSPPVTDEPSVSSKSLSIYLTVVVLVALIVGIVVALLLFIKRKGSK